MKMLTSVLLLSMLPFFGIGLIVEPTAAPLQNRPDPEQEIRQLLDSRDEQIKELIGPAGTEYTDDRREQIKTVINEIVSYRAMASTALGDTWTQITSEHREEFVDYFSTTIREHSMSNLDIYRAEVTYENVEVSGERAIVETETRLDNVRTPVNYLMEKSEENWLITDIVVDGVSTAESYHRQFQSIIRQHGFDALLDNLRRRAART